MASLSIADKVATLLPACIFSLKPVEVKDISVGAHKLVIFFINASEDPLLVWPPKSR